jgi:tetratricopeptide (TPR) repeat protein
LIRGAATALLLVLLGACGGQPPDRTAAIATFVQRQAEAAASAEAAGELAQALALWQSLLPLPNPPGAAQEAIARLRPEIVRRTAEAVQRGEAAYASGDWGLGDRWMLRALALTPGEGTASNRLREALAARARARQDAKSGREYELLTAGRPERTPAPEPTAESGHSRWAALYRAGEFQALVAEAESMPPAPHSEAAALLRDTHIQLADSAREREEAETELEHLQAALTAQPRTGDPLQGRVVRLRTELSRQWLKTGTGLMQSDLDAAIAALEKALLYHPGNDSASLQLKQAHTLQRNLSRIRARP